MLLAGLVILTMAALALTGGWLVAAGVRGRTIVRRPCCASCRYDLTGHDIRPSICAECGADLQRLGAVKVAHRRLRVGRLAAGVAVLAVTFSPCALVLLPKAAAVPRAPAAPLLARNAWRPASMPSPVTEPAPLRDPLPQNRVRDLPRPAFRPPVPTDGSSVVLGGYGAPGDPGLEMSLLAVPEEPGTWSRRRGALSDLPRTPLGRATRPGTGWASYPSTTTSRSGSHSSTLLRR